MKTMVHLLKNKESKQVIIEYVLISALVSLVAIISFMELISL